MNESDYSELPLSTKKMFCEKVLNYAQELLWLEEILIEFKDGSWFDNEYVDAFFVKKYFVIFVNESWLEKATLVDLTCTILHETRHAYQYAQVLYSEYMPYKEPKDKVDQWKFEFENYNKSSGIEELDENYMMQTIEIDAVAFEKNIIKELLDIDLIPHEFIEAEVNKVEIVINELATKLVM